MYQSIVLSGANLGLEQTRLLLTTAIYIYEQPAASCNSPCSYDSPFVSPFDGKATSSARVSEDQLPFVYYSRYMSIPALSHKSTSLVRVPLPTAALFCVVG